MKKRIAFYVLWTPVYIFQYFFHIALKFSLGVNYRTADSEESSALGYLNNRIMIYSNSWGPSDEGYVVDGPGPLLQETFENAIKLVSSDFYILLGETSYFYIISNIIN